MALDISILVNAMKANITSPTPQQNAEVTNFANAIKAFVESADVIYVAAALNSPSGTVTDAGTTIAKLQ